MSRALHAAAASLRAAGAPARARAGAGGIVLSVDAGVAGVGAVTLAPLLHQARGMIAS